MGKLEAQYFVHNMILDFLFNRPRQATNDLHGNNDGSLQVMFIVEKQHKFDILNIFSILEHIELYNLPLEILWHFRLGVCSPLHTISSNAFQVYSLYGGLYHRTQVS